jgi:hypothetical protein
VKINEMWNKPIEADMDSEEATRDKEEEQNKAATIEEPTDKLIKAPHTIELVTKPKTHRKETK